MKKLILVLTLISSVPLFCSSDTWKCYGFNSLQKKNAKQVQWKKSINCVSIDYKKISGFISCDENTEDLAVKLIHATINMDGKEPIKISEALDYPGFATIILFPIENEQLTQLRLDYSFAPSLQTEFSECDDAQTTFEYTISKTQRIIGTYKPLSRLSCDF